MLFDCEAERRTRPPFQGFPFDNMYLAAFGFHGLRRLKPACRKAPPSPYARKGPSELAEKSAAGNAPHLDELFSSSRDFLNPNGRGRRSRRRRRRLLGGGSFDGKLRLRPSRTLLDIMQRLTSPAWRSSPVHDGVYQKRRVRVQAHLDAGPVEFGVWTREWSKGSPSRLSGSRATLVKPDAFSIDQPWESL
jgi:hypothetical protein